MQNDIEKAIRDEAKRLDELYYQLADVLDVKASIILVVDTFLGTLSAEILALKDLPLAIKIIQLLAIAVLCVVIIQTIRAIWPYKFEAPPRPQEWVEHSAKLESYFAGKLDASGLISEQFERDMAKRTLDRIAVNRNVTEKKSDANAWAFRGTAVVIALQLITLIWLAFWHL